MGDDLRPNLQDLFHPSDRILEEPERGDGLEIPDVRPEVRTVAGGDAERVLELRADGEHRPRDRTRERDRSRRISARSTEQRRPPCDHACDRVIAARRDGAIVDEQRIRDRAEPLDGLGVVGADRLVGRVSRGHHGGRPTAASSRWCSGVYGNIRPTARSPVRPRGRARRLRDGEQARSVARSATSSATSAASSSASACAATRSATITANGFSSRRLRWRSVAIAAVQVASHARWNPPSPLIATISPRVSRAAASHSGSSVAIAHRRATTAPVGGRTPGTRWVARGTCDRADRRTRADTPGTSRTVHRRGRPIVRHARRDREARAARRAVRECVAMPAVARVGNLACAVGARREVGRDRQRAGTALDAMHDHEIVRRLVWDRFGDQLADASG